jgi:hypothetical protein
MSLWVECPSCAEQVDVIKAFSKGKDPETFGAMNKAGIVFRELLKGFPSPEPYSTKVICSLDIACPDCEYKMRITSLELEEG